MVSQAREKRPVYAWSDGLPTVPVTGERVASALDYLGAGGGDLVIEHPALRRSVTAEMAARLSLMAGCKHQYLPVVIAALEAVADPAFHLEHLASPSSPWPAFVVNGPIIRETALYTGPYVMAAGRRPNVTIARAISFILGNAGGEQFQGGVMGNPSRLSMVIPEEENTPWEPMHMQLGYPRETSTVTAFSTHEGSPLQVLPLGERYNRALAVASLLAEHCAAGWCSPGTQLILISPNAQRPFLEDKWSKEDLRRYLLDNATVSVAELKRRRRWVPGPGEPPSEQASAPIQPGDDERFLSLAKGEPFDKLYDPPEGKVTPPASTDFRIIVAGSEVAHLYMYLFYPFPTPPPSPVTKTVRPATGR